MGSIKAEIEAKEPNLTKNGLKQTRDGPRKTKRKIRPNSIKNRQK